METVTVKFEDKFLNEMEKIRKKHRYATKTEFIREAVRDKVKDLEKEEALMRVRKNYGAWSGKKDISDKKLHIIREEIAREYEKKFGLK